MFCLCSEWFSKSSTSLRGRSQGHRSGYAKSARARFSASGVCRARRRVERVFIHSGPCRERGAVVPRQLSRQRQSCRRGRSPGFEQKGNIENDDILAHAHPGTGIGPARRADEYAVRWLPRRSGFFRYCALQHRTVDGTVIANADGRYRDKRRTARTTGRVDPVHGGVRVPDRDALLLEHRRRRGLSHTDRTGQPDDRPRHDRTAARSSHRHGGRVAEPALEARNRLMQQHPEPIDGLAPPVFRLLQGVSVRKGV
jgi:hypothetical protein